MRCARKYLAAESAPNRESASAVLNTYFLRYFPRYFLRHFLRRAEQVRSSTNCRVGLPAQGSDCRAPSRFIADIAIQWCAHVHAFRQLHSQSDRFRSHQDGSLLRRRVRGGVDGHLYIPYHHTSRPIYGVIASTGQTLRDNCIASLLPNVKNHHTTYAGESRVIKTKAAKVRPQSHCFSLLIAIIVQPRTT